MNNPLTLQDLVTGNVEADEVIDNNHRRDRHTFRRSRTHPNEVYYQRQAATMSDKLSAKSLMSIARRVRLTRQATAGYSDLLTAGERTIAHVRDTDPDKLEVALQSTAYLETLLLAHLRHTITNYDRVNQKIKKESYRLDIPERYVNRALNHARQKATAIALEYAKSLPLRPPPPKL